MKIVKTLALFMLLSILTCSCQEENVADISIEGLQACNVRTIVYYIDGVEHSAVLHGVDEWDSFLSWMLALSREGCQVIIRDQDAVNATPDAKDVVTYTTTSEEDAKAWTMKKIDEGYSVQFYFDDHLGVYVCIAIK